MKKDKFEQIKPEAFEYRQEEFTPGLFLGAIISIVLMVGFIVLFAMIVAGGMVAISEAMK